MKARLLLSILCSMCLILLNARDPQIKQFGYAQGLPTDKVHRLLCDKEGYLWVATEMGLFRYNGKAFINYTIADGLSDNTYFFMNQDKNGRIWFLGYNGSIDYYENGKFYNAQKEAKFSKVKINSYFVDFFEDNLQRVWYIAPHDYFIIDKGNLSIIKQKITEYTGLVMNGDSGQIILSPDPPFTSRYYKGIRSPFNARYKPLSIATGYWRFNDNSLLFIASEGLVLQKDTAQKLILSIHENFEYNKPNTMVLSADSTLWISSRGKGLYRYNLKSPFEKPVIYCKNKVITCVVEDREGNIWFSSNNEGLFMIPGAAKQGVTIFKTGTSEFNNSCDAVHINAANEVIVGLKQGILKTIKHNAFYTIKSPLCPIGYNKIHTIQTDRDNIWLGSYCGLFHINHKTKCKHIIRYKDSATSALIMTSNVVDVSLCKKTVYFAMAFGILSYPAKCPGNHTILAKSILKHRERIYSIFADRTDRVWYSSVNGFRSVKDSQITDYSNIDQRLRGRINSIAPLDDSTLILGTDGYGLMLFRNNKILMQMTTKEGLLHNICKHIHVYHNQVYISTPMGVTVLFLKNNRVAKYFNINTYNFLPDNDANQVHASDSIIAIATAEGITTITRQALESFNSGIPSLILSDFLINGISNSFQKPLLLNYKNNNIQIMYQGIYFQDPHAVLYRYRLQQSETWKFTKSDQLDFPAMAPGNYQFEIQTSVGYGAWSNSNYIEFEIKNPFWKTNWFKLMCILLAGLITLGIVKKRIALLNRKHKYRMQIEQQMNQLEQKALQTIMNPHFVFNVMNSIQQYINNNDKDMANLYLSEFAKLIRLNLDLGLKDKVSLEEELSCIKLYLSLEKIRFGERFSYEINISGDIDDFDTMIPPMLIQPFLENAIWHGILPLKGNGHVILNIDKAEDGLLKIQIIDNGVGISENSKPIETSTDTHKSYGMSVTRQRMALIGKEIGCKLTIIVSKAYPENSNPGTKVELLLPDYQQ